MFRHVKNLKYDPKSTYFKRLQAKKKVMYAVFLRSIGLAKVIRLEKQDIVKAN